MTLPLRVLLVSANYKPSVGGIERYVEILAHGLAERGHRVTVATCRTDDSAREEQDDDVRIVRVRATDVLDDRLNVPYPLPEPVSALRTFRELLAEADLVHAHDAIYPTTVLALTIAHRRRIPSVLTQHVAFVPQHRRTLDLAQRAAIATLGRSARLAGRVVTYNPAVAEWARATWELPEVRVLPPGVPRAPEIDPDEVRKAFNLPTDRFLALFVGRDVPKKNLDLFLAAAGDPAYDLVAVTDRSPSKAPAGVQIVPFLEPSRFRQLLAALDAFVLPSEGEGFPLALQEALVTGVPCVVALAPGYERYLREGEVLLVERDAASIRAAIGRLAGDERLRHELAARARAAGAREFGVTAFAAGYEAVYEELV
jgi:D-inositol-3-phosphate glycosyltransferase